MGTFVAFSRDQYFLLPPDLKDWRPENDLAHCIVTAVERVRWGHSGQTGRPAQAVILSAADPGAAGLLLC